jgi:hypothetical protein
VTEREPRSAQQVGRGGQAEVDQGEIDALLAHLRPDTRLVPNVETYDDLLSNPASGR